MISQEEGIRAFRCISPTLELIRNEESFSRVLNSHTWKVMWVEPFGMDGFLTKIVCADCSLERTAIISNIQESVKAAQSNRGNEDAVSPNTESFARGIASGA